MDNYDTKIYLRPKHIQLIIFINIFSLQFIIPTISLSVPANPALLETLQPDGKKIKIHLRGDEHLSWHEDENGYAIKKDTKDAYWKYAKPKSHSVGFDIIEGATVGNVNPVNLKLKKGELPPKKILQKGHRHTGQGYNVAYPS